MEASWCPAGPAAAQAAQEILRNTKQQLSTHIGSEPHKFCAALHHALDISAVWAWRCNSQGDECLKAVLRLAMSLQEQGQLPEVRLAQATRPLGQGLGSHPVEEHAPMRTSTMRVRLASHGLGVREVVKACQALPGAGCIILGLHASLPLCLGRVPGHGRAAVRPSITGLSFCACGL